MSYCKSKNGSLLSASTTLIYILSALPMILACTSRPLPPGTRHATNHDARIVALQVFVVLMTYQVSQCYHHLMLNIVRFCVCPWIVRSQQKSRMTEHK
jgi:hypothetical protein